MTFLHLNHMADKKAFYSLHFKKDVFWYKRIKPWYFYIYDYRFFLFNWLSIITNTLNYHYYRTEGWKEELGEGECYYNYML